MLTVQDRVLVDRTPDDVLEFVMDIERYQAVDAKIRPVRRVVRTPTTTEFDHKARIGPIVVPGPQARSRMVLTPGERIEITLLRNPMRRLTAFRGSFEVTRTEAGTELLRTLAFTFAEPLTWLVEPYLRSRLPGAVAEELRLAKRYLEQGHP